MKANFEPACALIVGYEGGFVNNPRDPGGPTKYGITLKTLQRHRPEATIADIEALTPADAGEIYGEEYWPGIKGDDLPAGVDLLAFDASVNCGPGRAAKFVQTAVGVTADGLIGPGTLAAVGAAWADDASALIERIRTTRASYYRGLDGFPTFGNGWMNRLTAVSTTAKSWAARASLSA